MNIDTDTQWAYWEGLKNYYEKNKGYLQGQVGNPDGEDKPNKKFYDPRYASRHFRWKHAKIFDTSSFESISSCSWNEMM